MYKLLFYIKEKSAILQSKTLNDEASELTIQDNHFKCALDFFFNSPLAALCYHNMLHEKGKSVMQPDKQLRLFF